MLIRNVIAERILNGGLAAMEVPSADLEYRCFVGVYPLREEDGVVRIRIRKFCVVSERVEEYLYEGDLLNKVDLYVDNIENLEKVIQDMGCDPSQLDYPWRNAYPL